MLVVEIAAGVALGLLIYHAFDEGIVAGLLSLAVLLFVAFAIKLGLLSLLLAIAALVIWGIWRLRRIFAVRVISLPGCIIGIGAIAAAITHQPGLMLYFYIPAGIMAVIITLNWLLFERTHVHPRQ